ncbi:DUF4920 domain-containing protein [Zunongwangia sp.]|uniref:DUF4920 domain-containing protein n=1 Tax=Zunongwangia sp. TaxID=1965325 RepID=UPI003AA9B23E
MRKFTILLGFIFILIGCGQVSAQSSDESVKNEQIQESTYKSFGEKIYSENALSQNDIQEHYRNLKLGDTISIKIEAVASSVCKKKGCWMELAVPGTQDIRIRFKDYGFFVPKNIEGKQVIAQGKAFLKEVSVKELRHYAKDAGKTKEEIAAIIEPKRTWSFMADGVLIKQ